MGIYGFFAVKNDWPIKISPEKSKLGQYLMNDVLGEHTARMVNYAISFSAIAFGLLCLFGIVDLPTALGGLKGG